MQKIAINLHRFGMRFCTRIQPVTYRWFDNAIIAFGMLSLVSSIVLRKIFACRDFWNPPGILPG